MSYHYTRNNWGNIMHHSSQLLDIYALTWANIVTSTGNFITRYALIKKMRIMIIWHVTIRSGQVKVCCQFCLLHHWILWSMFDWNDTCVISLLHTATHWKSSVVYSADIYSVTTLHSEIGSTGLRFVVSFISSTVAYFVSDWCMIPHWINMS